MKRSEQDRLLREILEDESLAQLRGDSLARGLDVLRRRRQRRGAVMSSMVAAAMLIAIALVIRRPAKIISATPPAAPRTAGVKFIDDQQLLALFPDRSVALFGPPGHQQLVFLDAPARPQPRVENR